MATPGKAPTPLRDYGDMPCYQAAHELADEILRVARRIEPGHDTPEVLLGIEATAILLAAAEAGARSETWRRALLYRHGWFGTYRIAHLLNAAARLGQVLPDALGTDAVLRRAQQELTIWAGEMSSRLSPPPPDETDGG